MAKSTGFLLTLLAALLFFATTTSAQPTPSTGDTLIQSCGDWPPGCHFYVSPNGTLWRGGENCKPEECTYLDMFRGPLWYNDPDKFKGILQEISTLPDGIFDDLTSLQQLFIERTNIKRLPVDIFKNLHSLEWLSISNNQISELHNDIFKDLTSLRMLEIHNNQISHLPVGIFRNLRSLQRLIISNNQISNLPIGIFQNLSFLEVVVFDNNNIADLPVGIFHNLPSIVSIGLGHNKINTFSPQLLYGLISLQGLYLEYNNISILQDGMFKENPKIGVFAFNNNTISQLPFDIFPNTLEYIALGGNLINCIPNTSAITYESFIYPYQVVQYPVCIYEFKHISDHFAYPECIENRTWETIAEIYKNNQDMISSGDLGTLATEDLWMWTCFKDHPCLDKVYHLSDDAMCYKYNEKEEKWFQWALKSEISFCF